VHGQVHARERDRGADFLLAVDRQLARGIFLVLCNEAGALHEHAARTGRGIKHRAVIRFEHFHDETYDAGRRKKLAAALTFRAREFAQEIFVDSAERIVV